MKRVAKYSILMERHNFFFHTGVAETKEVFKVHKQSGDPMDTLELRNVLGRTVVNLRFVV